MKASKNELKERAIKRLKAEGQVPKRFYDELNYIDQHGGAQALLLLSDLVQHLKAEGILVGPGYGYATCSLLCYGLGLTDINPLKWGLPFERFTYSFQSERIFWIETSGNGLEKAKAYLNTRCSHPIEISPENKLVMELALFEDGKPFQLHVGITGNAVLDKLLAKGESLPIGMTNVDETTLQRFKQGDTSDIWGFEAVEMRAWLVKLNPSSLSDLILTYALYRPSLIKLLPEVTKRKQTNEIPSTGIEEVDNILEESYGELVYQEQVFLIQKALKDMQENADVAAVRNMIDVPMQKLYLKGHAAGRVMMGIGSAQHFS